MAQVAARPARRKGQLCPDERLAAVGHQRPAFSDQCADLVRQPEGMDGAQVGVQAAGEHRASGVAGLPELLQPLVAPGEGLPARRAGEGAQRLAAVRHDPQLDVAAPPDLRPVDVYLDDLRLPGDDGLTAAREHAEPSAQQEHGVGTAGQGHPAAGHHEAPQAELAVLWERAAGHTVHAHRDAAELGELPKLGRGLSEPYTAPGEDDRSLGR